jgi:putative aldouronate transport system permease protein
MKVKDSVSRKAFLVVNTILLALIGFACFAPMWHVLCCSISNPSVLARKGGFHLLPIPPFSIVGYEAVFGYRNILTGFLNTIFYVVAGVFLNMVLTIMAAFVLSRKRFLLCKTIMILMTFTMLFNGGLIPTYLVFVKLGLINTRLAILLCTAFNVFNMVILRTSFQGIPDALEESARLDGANDLVILVQIILPLSKASVAVITLFVAVGIWNSWFTSAIYLMDRGKWPIQMFLREVLINNSQKSLEAGAKASAVELQILVKYAITIVATLPILCIYPFVQKYFVQGVMIGSIKG